MAKLVVGINDLATLHPEVAAEADGWDPSSLSAGSGKKMSWVCKKRHTWKAIVAGRTREKKGCPYCSNKKIWTGFNDLKTKFPEIAKEADGWDPTKFLSGVGKKMKWKCSLGHSWSARIDSRTGTNKTGCPFCSNHKILKGFNDLQTTFPDLAKEADGWDPTTLFAGTQKVLPWQCALGHKWRASVGSRKNGRGCPFCSNRKILKGFNDLQTTFPDLAKEADGWDPETMLAGSHTKMPWQCKKNHKWIASISHRANGRGCPFCANRKVLMGFNDLKTKFPEIAQEADGWDPATVLASTTTKMPWKCQKGHTWNAQCAERTGKDKTSCPYCAEYQFRKEDPAWFYLMQKEGEQQFGITNNWQRRKKEHARSGWKLIEKVGPIDGEIVFNVELYLKEWLKKDVGVIPRKKENWFTSRMKVHSLAELKEKSGIETSIF